MILKRKDKERQKLPTDVNVEHHEIVSCFNQMNFKIDHNNSYISNQNNLFILVSLFHINGFINNESLSALFKNLKEGRLNRNVNTYRSNITKEWYNDESIYEIFSDVFWKMLSPKGKQKIKLERLNKLRSIDGLPIKTYQTSLS